MRLLRRLWVAILPAYEVRVIPWPGWDDADAPPPVWSIDDWRALSGGALQPGVRGIVAERRIPRTERVLRWLRDQIHDQQNDAPGPESDAADAAFEPDADDPVRVRPADDDRDAHRPPGV